MQSCSDPVHAGSENPQGCSFYRGDKPPPSWRGNGPRRKLEVPRRSDIKNEHRASVSTGTTVYRAREAFMDKSPCHSFIWYHLLGRANWKALRSKLLEVVEALEESSRYAFLYSTLGLCFLEAVTEYAVRWTSSSYGKL